MARSTRSAATERAYHHFATRGLTTGYQAPAGLPGTSDEFDESDVWGSFNPAEEAEQPSARAAAELHRVRTVPSARPGRKAKPVGGGAAHGSLPVAIPDWSKILGDEYEGHYQAAGEWDLDDADVEGAPVVPPHELAWRRRAASLSVNDGMGIGRMLKVRDAVWKKTGFQA